MCDENFRYIGRLICHNQQQLKFNIRKQRLKSIINIKEIDENRNFHYCFVELTLTIRDYIDKANIFGHKTLTIS